MTAKSLLPQLHCEICKSQIYNQDRTSHLRQAHPAQFSAAWASIESAAARFRRSAA